MSRVATTAFAKAWGSANAQRVLLMKVEISAPSSITLRLATGETYANGLMWQEAIRGDVNVRESSPFLSPGPDLATCEVTLENRYVSDASGLLVESLANLQWQGATVTLYRWERSLSSFSTDALQIFKGRVNRPTSGTDGTLTLPLMQGRVWNRRVPTKALDKINYPNAPDIGSGTVVPVVYGQFKALNMRAPWSTAYTERRDFEDMGAGCGAVPYILTDPGLGSNNVRATVAGHPCKTILGRSSGFTFFIVGGDQLDPVDTSGLTTSIASDSYIEIDDEKLIAYHGIRANDVYTATTAPAAPTTSNSPRNCMDIFDETSYSNLDQAGGETRLTLALARPQVVGQAIEATMYIAYSGDAGNANNLQWTPYNPVNNVIGTVRSVAATSATPATNITGTWRGPAAAIIFDYSLWNITGTGDNTGGGFGGTTGLIINFAAGATNKAHIFAWALVLTYRPQRTLVTPAQYIYDPYYENPNPDPNDPSSFRRRVVRAAALKVDGAFYGHVEGYADTGGTYTGSGTDLIQRPPDIAHHLLVTYGGLSSSDIETGAATFGSFVRARSFLRGGAASDYVLACHIGQKSSVQQVAQGIAQQSLSLLYIDGTDNKWKWITWDRDKPVDYDVVLNKDCLPITGGRVRQDPHSDVGVRQSITAPFYYDHFRNRSMFEAKVGPAISTRGYNQPTYQDQQSFVVDATNNDIDWTSGGVNYTDTLASATYADPMALAAQLRTQLRTRDADIHTGWGFSIRTSHAYIIAITVSAVDYDAELAEGDYGPETLAAEAARALNAEAHGLTFTVTYSHTTNKFTIAASGTFTLRAQGAHHMGFSNAASGTSLTAEYARYAETFWVLAYTPTFAFRWASGANTATGAHMLLGFDVADTATVSDISASYRRNNREALAQDSADTWGELEELTLPSSYIRQEETAVLYRDRSFDLRSEPRMKIEFPTHRMPDVQRGRVFETDEDLDELGPFTRYGSDGSWADKRFMVTEVVRHNGTAWHDEVVAIEVTPATA